MPSLFRKKQKPTQVNGESPSSITPNPSLFDAENNSGTMARSPSLSPKTGNSRTTSSGEDAALSAFKSALILLGKAPFPGIDIVTFVLSGVVSGIQGSSQAETGWRQLTERMERLWYLVSQTQGIDVGSEELCTPLIKELENLADDIKRASKQGKLLAFFNSTDDLSSVSEHREVLDGIIIDLTATIGAATHRTATQLRDDCQKAISQVHAEKGSSKGSSHGIITNMTNNVAEGIDGTFGAENKVYGRAVMIHEIHGNQFGHVGGSMFSGNIVDNR